MDTAVLEQAPSEPNIHPVVAGVGRGPWVPVVEPGQMG